MSREEASKWLRRFYWALKNNTSLKVKFKKDLCDPREKVVRPKWGLPGNIAGLRDETGQIILNPSRRVYGGITKILVHELIHSVDDKLTERETTDLENLIYEALSDRQLLNLMRRALET